MLGNFPLSFCHCQKNPTKNFPLWSANRVHIFIKVSRQKGAPLLMLLLAVLDSAMPLCLHMSQRKSQEFRTTWWPDFSIVASSMDPYVPDRMSLFQSLVEKSRLRCSNSAHRPAIWLARDLVPEQLRWLQSGIDNATKLSYWWQIEQLLKNIQNLHVKIIKVIRSAVSLRFWAYSEANQVFSQGPMMFIGT